ncbi:MAG TPA: hypothetical protein VND22_08710 [Actinomycetota bacterium]|nr:hypothetical protein [Actinomycetota bacterium]
MMLLLLAIFALSARQPPPPTIAEFAPQAVEQITDAPSEQSSQFGSGAGEGECLPGAECGPGEGGGGGGGQAPSIKVPRVRKCVGDPPRQIEDPQSPPCVPYWEGDNGGATSKGVTRDTIRIAAPWIETGPDQGAPGMTQGMNNLVNFFNKRFEFYGRKIHVEPYPGPGPDDYVVNQAQMEADAAGVDAMNVFASTPYADHGGAEYHYMDALARLGVISTSNARGLLVDEDHYSEFQPYQWNTHPGVAAIARNLGEFVCKQLAGGNAVYAEGREANKPRVFGMIKVRSNDGSTPDTAPLVAELSRCGVRIKETVEVSGDLADQAGKQNAMIQFQNAEVTSIISWAFAATMAFQIYPAAEQQGYLPEWIVSSYGGQLEEGACIISPAKRQCDNAFGIDFRNKENAQEDLPIHWAMTEMDPGYNDEQGEAQERYMYWPLLMIASGIQMAGPNLTPETFQQGLMKARFPNPACGDAPYYQACVGFGSTDHTFFNDATMKWWSNTQQSRRSDIEGAYCYIDHGKRYGFGEWPTEKKAFFEGDCY